MINKEEGKGTPQAGDGRCHCGKLQCLECYPYQEVPSGFQKGLLQPTWNNMPQHLALPHFEVKDSGQRAEFASGMVRDVNTDKLRPDLVFDGPMLFRWIKLMTNGAKKYAVRNWMKAAGQEEKDRFLESFMRHAYIYYMYEKYGINYEDSDNPTSQPLTEDHAAATMFNVNGHEYVKGKMDAL